MPLRQIAVLLLVSSASEKQTIRGIAATLGVSKPAVTRAVDKLSSAELVVRQVDMEDRRSIFVLMGKPGIAYVKTLTKQFDKIASAA